MSFEHSPFARQLFEAGTPQKSSPKADQSFNYKSPNTSSFLEETFRRRSSGQFNLSNVSNVSHDSSLFLDSTPSKQRFFTDEPSNSFSGMQQNSSFRSKAGERENTSSARLSNNKNKDRFPKYGSFFGGSNSSFTSITPHTPSRQLVSSADVTQGSNSSSFLADSSFASQGSIDSKHDRGRRLRTLAAAQADGSPLRVPPNVYSPSQSETPTGSWKHPSADDVLSRRINKEECVWQIVFTWTALTGIYFLRGFVSQFDWLSIFRESSLVSNILTGLMWIYRLVAFSLAINLGVSAYNLARPNDKCEDIPLTQEQRQLLGLPPSPKAVPKSTHTPPQYVKSIHSSPLSSLVSGSSPLSKHSTNTTDYKKVVESPSHDISLGERSFITKTSSPLNGNTHATTHLNVDKSLISKSTVPAKASSGDNSVGVGAGATGSITVPLKTQASSSNSTLSKMGSTTSSEVSTSNPAIKDSESDRVSKLIDRVLERHGTPVRSASPRLFNKLRRDIGSKEGLSDLTTASPVNGSSSLYQIPHIPSSTAVIRNQGSAGDTTGSHSMFRYHQGQIEDLTYNI